MTGDIKPTSDATAALYGARDRNVRQQTSSESGVAASQHTPATADTVQLTDRAQQLVRLEGVLAEIPVVDSQKVDAIRQSIADGTYKVDSQLIAERMLQLEADQKSLES